jgi:glycosyltransferase involved in cell wall biosynthesis
MPQQLALSIVIINYNYAHFLSEAIASALAVHAVDREIIVVDDGSTDHSSAVIRGFGSRIRPVFKKNGGALTAINEGFRHARGDVIIFLDGDDRLREDVARHVFSVWDSTVAKVQYLGRVIDGSGVSLNRVQPNFTKVPSQRDIVRSLVSGTTYVTSPCSGNAYARWYLEQVLPLPERYTAHRNAPDDLINPAAPLYGKVVTLLVPLFDYRHHDANDSGAGNFDVANLTRMLRRDEERFDFVREKSGLRGASIKPDALLNSPYHMIACLAIRRHTPLLDTYDFSLGKLLTLGLSATLRYPAIGRREKVILATLLVGIALTPRPIALWLVECRYVPNRRPKWAAAALARIGVKANAPAPAGAANGNRAQKAAGGRR